MAAEQGAGTLFVCGTPIGNLDDVTPRMREVFAAVSVIAAEDTRRTRRLLSHLDIGTSTLSYHQHNERDRTRELLARLEAGEDMALVTDAGMPGICDPGAELVDAALQAEIPVRVVPGPSALSCALALSGFVVDRFCFEGFLPARGSARHRRLDEVATESRPVVLYEAPHRLARTLADLAERMPGRLCLLARELTKLHEEVCRSTLAALADEWAKREAKGEIVLVLGPWEAAAETGEEIASDEAALVAAVAERVERGVDKKQAIREVAQLAGVPKRVVYAAVNINNS